MFQFYFYFIVVFAISFVNHCWSIIAFQSESALELLVVQKWGGVAELDFLRAKNPAPACSLNLKFNSNAGVNTLADNFIH